jgi:hypothetical protein
MHTHAYIHRLQIFIHTVYVYIRTYIFIYIYTHRLHTYILRYTHTVMNGRTEGCVIILPSADER